MGIEYPPGTPSWCDLNTSDVESAARFYGALFGWSAQDLGPEARGYRMLMLDDRPVAGLGPLQEDSGPPHWMTYVATEDAEATAAAVERGGGKTYLPPMDVLDAGRMAIFTDPAGAFFAVWQPGRHRAAQVVNQPCAMSWNELDTRDAGGAQRFYGDVFGWDAEPLEHEGQVAYYAFKLGGRTIGGMLPMGDAFPPDIPPNWVVYFGTDDMDRAAGKLQQMGGAVLVPARDMPNGRFSVARDPQGAVFALWEGSYDDPPGA